MHVQYFKLENSVILQVLALLGNKLIALEEIIIVIASNDNNLYTFQFIRTILY